MYLIPSATINSPIHLCRRRILQAPFTVTLCTSQQISRERERESRAVTESQNLHNAFHTVQIAFSEWRLWRWQLEMCHCCCIFLPLPLVTHTNHSHLPQNSRALINSIFSSAFHIIIQFDSSNFERISLEAKNIMQKEQRTVLVVSHIKIRSDGAATTRPKLYSSFVHATIDGPGGEDSQMSSYNT